MRLIINTDGGSRGNPGPAAIGVVVRSENIVVYELGLTIGVTTNNVAEYTAVLKAIEYLASLPSSPESVQFLLDSKLVVEQLNGKFAIKNAGLRPLFDQIQKERKQFDFPTYFSYVPRAENAAADLLVNKALDSAR